MLYAIKPNTTARITPSKTGQTAFCELCGESVISKCGRIKSKHWAHSSGADCDSWAEISAWHLMLQNGMEYNGASIEVVVEKNRIKHRADAIFPNGKIVEVQHSSISPDEIEEREAFYENMIWLFDARNAYDSTRLLLKRQDKYWTFHWIHPRKSIIFAQKPVFLHLGMDEVFEIKKMYKHPALSGWGHKISWKKFLSKAKQ